MVLVFLSSVCSDLSSERGSVFRTLFGSLERRLFSTVWVCSALLRLLIFEVSNVEGSKVSRIGFMYSL